MNKNRLKEFNDKASWLRKGVLYHRGKHNEIVKENTIEAFKGAVEDGLGVELDVRLTKDNQVVVSHDGNLKRVFGIEKIIEESNYEEIKEYVPLFKDVLNLINDKVGVMVEVKSSKVGMLEEETYKILKEYKGRCVIVSFNPFTLNYFRKKDPSIIRGQLSYNYKDSKYNCILKLALKKMWLNIFSKPHFISYGIDGFDYKLLNKYHKKGYFIIGWTYSCEENKLNLKKVYDNMIIEKLSIKEF